MVGPAKGKGARGKRRILPVARIAGVNIPTNKRVTIALRYIHGIGGDTISIDNA